MHNAVPPRFDRQRSLLEVVALRSRRPSVVSGPHPPRSWTKRSPPPPAMRRPRVRRRPRASPRGAETTGGRVDRPDPGHPEPLLELVVAQFRVQVVHYRLPGSASARSLRLPRCIRLSTVPLGLPVTFAISSCGVARHDIQKESFPFRLPQKPEHPADLLIDRNVWSVRSRSTSTADASSDVNRIRYRRRCWSTCQIADDREQQCFRGVHCTSPLVQLQPRRLHQILGIVVVMRQRECVPEPHLKQFPVVQRRQSVRLFPAVPVPAHSVCTAQSSKWYLRLTPSALCTTHCSAWESPSRSTTRNSRSNSTSWESTKSAQLT